MKSLFLDVGFTSHSGLWLPFKIDCDALTDTDLNTLALIVARDWRFRDVIGVPTGGERFADKLSYYKSKDGPLLIVDDVLTTGKSMEHMRKEYGTYSIGIVIFARGKCPEWVRPIFQLSIGT